MGLVSGGSWFSKLAIRILIQLAIQLFLNYRIIFSRVNAGYFTATLRN